MDDFTERIGNLNLGKYSNAKYSRPACVAAINGEAVPNALVQPVHGLCTVRGIRYNPGFGEELRDVLPELTRALNARTIMSNSLPDLRVPEHRPYCIWHPQIPSEDTCRQLVKQCPEMAYRELIVVPEIHVAEEARKSGSYEIFEQIMSQPTRYSVMNDYTRSIDPAVYWLLDVKQRFGGLDKKAFNLYGFNKSTFNITEDMNIGIDNIIQPPTSSRRASKSDLVELLTEPLPQDLPTVDKDLLICMAAYYGDIDRFVRLRRPKMLDGEAQCCQEMHPEQSFPVTRKISMAIEARFVMNNVLWRAFTSTNFCEPYLIWWPTFAAPSTYESLAQLRPNMLPQIIRACVVAGYQTLFDKLVAQFIPDHAVLNAASRCENTHYRQVLEQRVVVVGKTEIAGINDWQLRGEDEMRTSSTWVQHEIGMNAPRCYFEQLYNGDECDASDVELMACIPEEWRKPADHADLLELDYEAWPPQSPPGEK
ncbi:hypothetical protein Slin15195_G092840 [Septoria linicola]|uniref:Uncharacterized protein n=1 Tax=Septoria linicola TaxID=215465 RepID=A0A9Q9EME9_9PEZI|nr:hypothetical protein Slin15195_G092840 [Septoria linicola]